MTWIRSDRMRGAEEGPIEAVPELYFAPPDCAKPGCDGTPDTDGGGWWCDSCGSTWDRHGHDGIRMPQEQDR